MTRIVNGLKAGRHRRAVAIAVGCLLLFLSSMAWAQGGFGSQPGIPHHHQAPDFHVTTIDGTTVSKTSLKGGPTLMMFWAPWCHVCQMELPKIHAFHEAIKPYGLRVLSIGFADAKENVLGYIRAHPKIFTFPSAFDVDNIVAADFRVRATPTFVLVDGDGFVRLVHPGAGVLQNPKLLAFVEDLIS